MLHAMLVSRATVLLASAKQMVVKAQMYIFRFQFSKYRSKGYGSAWSSLGFESGHVPKLLLCLLLGVDLLPEVHDLGEAIEHEDGVPGGEAGGGAPKAARVRETFRRQRVRAHARPRIITSP